MTTVRLLLLPCLLLALTGCGRANPRPVATPSEVSQPSSAEDVGASIGDQISAAFSKATENFERQRLVLLVNGVRDAEHWNTIKEQAETLIDPGDNRSVLSKGGYGNGYYLKISPVSDVVATADKIKFGSVVAVDSEQRTIVVDASRPSAQRPETGWPGQESLQAFLKREAIQWIGQQANENRLQEVGRDRIVTVAYFAAVGDAESAKPLHEQLSKLPGELNSTISYQTYGPNFQSVAIATIESELSVAEIAQTIGGDGIWTDEVSRVLVLSTPSGP